MAMECPDELISAVLRAAMTVHRTLGPGLLESIYERALQLELAQAGIEAASQVPVPVSYRGVNLGLGFRIDLLVGRCLILEIKSVERFDDSHVKQLLSYLRLADVSTGLLLNFNRAMLKQGIKRVSLFPGSPCAP